MASFKCLQFFDNCFFKKNLYSHLQNIVDIRQFGKNFWCFKAKRSLPASDILVPLRQMCFSFAPAGMPKYHMAAGVLSIVLPNETVNSLLGFLAKTGSGRAGKYFYSFNSLRCVLGRQEHHSCFG